MHVIQDRERVKSVLFPRQVCYFNIICRNCQIQLDGHGKQVQRVAILGVGCKV